MEAKVDIRKLQLLNDRINQTIDALNQVRLSVHGLAHTAGLPGQVPGQIPGMGFGTGVPFGGGQQGIGQGYGFPNVPQAFGGWGQGMSHTAGVPGYGINAWGGQGQTPWGVQAGMQAGLQPQNPLAQLLGINPMQTGFSHSGGAGVEGLDPSRQMYAQWLLQQTIDPYYAMRVSQTFPFAQQPVSPVG